MAAFKNEPEEWQRLDWIILQNGWVSLYHRPEFLLIDISWFRKERYRVVELNCADWSDEKTLLADLKFKFRLQDECSDSLDNLKEGLKEISIVGAGLVVVLHHLDKVENHLAQALLSILSESSRFQMLLGDRMITLAQVDDENTNYDPIGAMAVGWNPHE